ncbi:MAG TPA: ABC transporter ATP-binding protein [Acidimicrobiales bacterium]|nr:ABC transporter ATP-binding protein [Acidimicrobiales bacterium]
MAAAAPATSTGPATASTPLLEIFGLTVGYGWEGRPMSTVVRGVDLSVGAGEVVGIAGESGCGKTTLALAATGLLDPPGQVLSGSVRFCGRDLLALSQRELRTVHLSEISMVFQASMNVLNPVMRIRDQFLDAMKAHGVEDRDGAVARAKEMFDLVKVPRRFFEAFPHQLSGGMRQRTVIALALVLRPQLLVLDEPTTALDVVVQRSILEMLDELRNELGFGVVFITHDLSLLVEIADRITIMYAGLAVEQAPARQLYEGPRHPYSQALMRAFPPLGGERRRLEGIAGQPPDLRQLPPGCSFQPRCPRAIAGTCEVVAPPLVRFEAEHWAVCHLYDRVDDHPNVTDQGLGEDHGEKGATVG